jgi:hypothetical protein
MRVQRFLADNFRTVPSRLILIVTLLTLLWGLNEAVNASARNTVRRAETLAKQLKENPNEEQMVLLSTKEGALQRFNATLETLRADLGLSVFPVVTDDASVLTHLGDVGELRTLSIEHEEVSLDEGITLLRWTLEAIGEYSAWRAYVDHVSERSDVALESISVTSDPAAWPSLRGEVSVAGYRIPVVGELIHD